MKTDSKKHVDCFGFPLPKPTKMQPKELSERADAAIKKLESLAMAGDAEAMNKFELLLAQMGSKNIHFLKKRSKVSGTSFNGGSVIAQLLHTADDMIECLGWVAKNRKKACEHFAEKRLTWPGYISSLKSIEDKSQALKDCLPLGRDHNYHPKTVADKLFSAARFTIKYLSGDDWQGMANIYFAPFIRGVEWMPRDECLNAIKQFRQRQGPLTRTNWPKWKPIFERFITLRYGPSRERWKLIPSSPIPKKLAGELSISEPFTWKECIRTATNLGVTNEWFQHCVATRKLTLAEKADLQNEVKRIATQNPLPSIMDIDPDDTLKNIKSRVEHRDGGWGDYKTALLLKCRKLLPE